ncbi:hypothetical protein Tco_1181915 [Tanacetum coccineum]
MKSRRARAMNMTIHSSIKARILEAQSEASKGANTPAEMLKELDKQFERKKMAIIILLERNLGASLWHLRSLLMNEAPLLQKSILYIISQSRAPKTIEITSIARDSQMEMGGEFTMELHNQNTE